MPRNRLALTPENEERIKAALEVDPHATRVTSSFNGEFSYSTVQRVAYRNDIPLTAGRETMGPSRLPPERRAKVEALVEANPGASQSELERLSGVSRKVVRQCADQVGVELTGGRKKVGHPPLSAEVVAKIEEAVRANPKARWEWIARKTGVSRSSVGRVMPARRRAALGLGS